MTQARTIAAGLALALLLFPLLAGCSGSKNASNGGLETLSTEDAYKRSMKTLKEPGKPLFPGGSDKSEHPQPSATRATAPAAGAPTGLPPTPR